MAMHELLTLPIFEIRFRACYGQVVGTYCPTRFSEFVVRPARIFLCTLTPLPVFEIRVRACEDVCSMAR